MAPVDIYGYVVGGPLRGILSVCKLGDIPYNFIEVNMKKGEHLTEDYLKINPEHTVPAMKDIDNDFCLWESRAIMIYLAEKYSKDKHLYPADDIETRARINRLLFFDLEKLSGKMNPVVYAKMTGGQPDEEKVKAMHDALTTLDNYIAREKTDYLVGNHVTIADLLIRSNLTYLEFLGEGYSEYKNITAFVERMKKLPCEELHENAKVKAQQMRKEMTEEK